MRPQPDFISHITTLGTGDRQALALHCTMAFGGAWNGFSKAMPELTLNAPDMPSHGRSADWDGDSNFGDTVYAASLSALGEGPMDVIGHSFGAMTALRLVASHPARIRSLTLIEPVFFAIAMREVPQTLAHHDQSAKPFREAIEAGDMETAARTFNQMWSTDGPAWETLPDRTRAAMMRGVRVVPDTYSLLYDDEAGLLVPGVLEAVTVPTLILRGEQAHPAITAINNGLVGRMPTATQAVIRQAGHMAPISHPGAVAEEVRGLLARS